jgi:hypothetical protein
LFLHRRRRCYEKTFEIEGQKWKGTTKAWGKTPSLLFIFFPAW